MFLEFGFRSSKKWISIHINRSSWHFLILTSYSWGKKTVHFCVSERSCSASTLRLRLFRRCFHHSVLSAQVCLANSNPEVLDAVASEHPQQSTQPGLRHPRAGTEQPDRHCLRRQSPCAFSHMHLPFIFEAHAVTIIKLIGRLTLLWNNHAPKSPSTSAHL